MTEQTPRLDVAGFTENVVASGLMDREEMSRALEGAPTTDRAKVVARYLVETGRLTKFQAEKILAGRTDGFLLDKYRVLEELGRGGMGRVYKAVHQTMGRFVALKLLAPDLTKTDKAKELFEKEVKAAARLNHQNIVTAFDANHSGDRFFLVMEYVDGPNLSQLVKERGPLPIEQACEYIRQAAIGLAYAHEMGLIHRDVKPSNLLVQQTTTGPQVKILDFGLALVTANEGAIGDSLHAGTNTVLGTPDYVSPEQAKNQFKVDGRSDLYSLGCTFYYLLTGEPPFPGGTALEKMVRHGADAPESVLSRRGDIPEPVAAIVHKLLAKNPKWRYQKAGELASELVAIVGQKANWSAPSRPAPKRRPDSGASISGGEEEFDDLDLEEQPSASTLPTAMMSTRETTVRTRRDLRRKPRRKRVLWPWIVLSIALAFGVVAGVGLLVRHFLQQTPQ